MSNRAKRAQEKVIEEKLEEMVLHYLLGSGGKAPEQVCVDQKTYRGKILRWLEPLLVGQTNVLLIEEQLGDNWTLRFEPFDQPIKVYV
jgi:hypothetical protein